VPILEYNGKPEVLTSAQGRNGAFWYDPENGLWYAENAQLLPLIDAFKQQGITTTAKDGVVSSTATGNVTNVNVGASQEIPCLTCLHCQKTSLH